jgi:sterol desaturase/sphingolipid hydroxylase (fatty acid hydroxylase superfamily)
MDPKLITGLVSITVFFILEHFYPHYRGRIFHFRHSLYNLSIAFINGLLGRFVFLGINLWALSFISRSGFGLLNMGGISGPVRVVLGLVLFDIWMYLWHRANHRIAFLWRFHKAHHNDTEMDASTSLRLHPAEIIFSTLFRLPVYFLIGMDAAVIASYEAVLMISIPFHHSNTALPAKLDRILRMFLVTPDMHRIHHSIVPGEVNSNYSSIVPLWDKLFRSYTSWTDTGNTVLGLKIFRKGKWQTPAGILALPFVSEKKEV